MSLSDYSSLTDISDEDEPYTPAPKTKKTREKAQYTIKPILKPPRQTTYSAKALYEMMVEGSIDLNPEYQRDVVWTDTKQSNLIDSLLRNFVIPPVIFALHVAEDGTEKRICIDGKQRLTSILRFMDGQIPHKDSRNSSKHWYKLTSSNKAGKLLPVPYRQQFALKQIVCIEYLDIDDKAEREIFQRVQLGVALTPAERMQAISTPWADLVRTAVKKVDESISSKLDWQSQRGRDFQCLASVIYLAEKKSITFAAASSLELWMKRTTGPSDLFKEKIFEAIAVFSILLDDKKNAKTFQEPAKVSPVEFIMVLYLIHQYMKTSSLKQLNTGIAKLRSDVRSAHTDIRNNGKCNKTMLSFIKDRYPSSLKKTDGETALEALQKIEKAKPRGSKRKREEPASEEEDVEMGEQESDDEDDVPLRSKSQSPIKKSSRTVSGITATPKVKAEKPKVKAETPKVKAESSRRSSTPSKPAVKMEVDTPASRPQQQNGAPPKNDRLAAVRAAHKMLQSAPTSPTGSAMPRPMSRLSTDMGPPTQSAGTASSQPPTPSTAAPPPPPSSSVPPSSGGSQPPGALSQETMQNLQNILQKVQSPLSAGPNGQAPFTDASQMSATQWPAQVPGAPPTPTQPHAPPPPQSAPTTDPRVRSNSNSSLPLPPRPPNSYNNGTTHNQAPVPYVPGQTPAPPYSASSAGSSSSTAPYRRASMDSNGGGGGSRSSAAMPSSSRFDDDRMDRRRDSRFDDRSSKPISHRDRPHSPSRERYRDPPPPPRYHQSNGSSGGRERDRGWGDRLR